MTTKELTALAREAFGDKARAGYFRMWGGEFEMYAENQLYRRVLSVRGDTKAEAEARFVACLRAIREVEA